MQLDRTEVCIIMICVCITRRSAILCAGLVATIVWTAPSHAEDQAADVAPTSGITVTRTNDANGTIVVERWVNRPPEESPPAATGAAGTLLAAGVLTFGLAYVPAVATAGESALAIDRQLYVPIAGPWIDLAGRPNCGARSLSCSAEAGNQALLIVDGFFQGLGLIQVLAGLGQLAHDAPATAQVDERPAVHVRPAQLAAGGYGLAAIGKF